MGLIRNVLSGSNDSRLRKLKKMADAVEALELEFKALDDNALKAKTEEYKKRHEEGESLDDLLPEVFAQVREASVRVLGMRHFYVQIVGGIVLHQGRIAEMKTGEGKTLAATLAVCLNALSGKGVHVVTVNDYLAKRDSEWMGKLYSFLGYTVGLIIHDIPADERRESYGADIVYGTNNEFGFDYLRDNMAIRKERMVQRELNYAVVDEVDSILIDEARTPLIISGAGDKSTDMYTTVDRFVKTLKFEDDFTIDEKLKAINLTEQGIAKSEKAFNIENLADIEHTELNHHINQALKANNIMKRDIDYVVKDGQVIIVDEFTGRMMMGRRYSEGLHQAIEAKESVQVARESKTLATITFQNYFRMYTKLAGMTGTAKTEEDEFIGIYNLDVVQVPTNRPMIREDNNDIIYATEHGKFRAVVEEIRRVHATGRPILVGTVSVEKSELLSGLLIRTGIKHNVLNAKHHEKEALIVAQAGKKGTVTIATNMAGRGTDIILGGNPDFSARGDMMREGFTDEMIEQAVGHAATDNEEILNARKRYAALLESYKKSMQPEHNEVVSLGGLHIVGTERHESRRIDNQLRGRSGRQGDPGSSVFFISLEDDLMRRFGGERIQGFLQSVNKEDDIPLAFGLLTKQIEGAQKRIEFRNYEIRKHVLQYDDVMNRQRELIYSQRRMVLTGADVKDNIMDMLQTLIDDIFAVYCPEGVFPEEWDIAGMAEYFSKVFLPKDFALFKKDEIETLTHETAKEIIRQTAQKLYKLKEEEIEQAGQSMREIERILLLRAVDQKWMAHIDAMDQLRQGIGLRAYGQRDPVVEYRREGFDMFEEMIHEIQQDTVTMMYHVKVTTKPVRREAPAPIVKKVLDAKGNKVGRNAPCPCGSGKKFKNCCGMAK
ncbi:MAG: preprotein translocase subunit SecA [Eubacteriales bacterium]|nr:preprotein translocase subunit SecA [Eubacteriales bacterium]